MRAAMMLYAVAKVLMFCCVARVLSGIARRLHFKSNQPNVYHCKIYSSM